MTKGKSKEKAKRRRVTLSLDAPHATEVSLMGDFNKWNVKTHPMKKSDNGVWKKTVMLQPGRYEYKLMVDGEWQNDPGNHQTCMNCFGTHNNFVVVSS
jgi:1,4-alpha-glucan branching enzyme